MCCFPTRVGGNRFVSCSFRAVQWQNLPTKVPFGPSRRLRETCPSFIELSQEGASDRVWDIFAVRMRHPERELLSEADVHRTPAHHCRTTETGPVADWPVAEDDRSKLSDRKIGPARHSRSAKLCRLVRHLMMNAPLANRPVGQPGRITDPIPVRQSGKHDHQP